MKVDYFDGEHSKIDSESLRKHMHTQINWNDVDMVRDQGNHIVIVFNSGKERVFNNIHGSYVEVYFE